MIDPNKDILDIQYLEAKYPITEQFTDDYTLFYGAIDATLDRPVITRVRAWGQE